MRTAIRCSLMRGGRSKGLYFRKEDQPADIVRGELVVPATLWDGRR